MPNPKTLRLNPSTEPVNPDANFRSLNFRLWNWAGDADRESGEIKDEAVAAGGTSPPQVDSKPKDRCALLNLTLYLAERPIAVRRVHSITHITPQTEHPAGSCSWS